MRNKARDLLAKVGVSGVVAVCRNREVVGPQRVELWTSWCRIIDQRQVYNLQAISTIAKLYAMLLVIKDLEGYRGPQLATERNANIQGGHDRFHHKCFRRPLTVGKSAKSHPPYANRYTLRVGRAPASPENL